VTASEIKIRPLESRDDYLQCVALQHEIWGADFGEAVPPSILLATQEVGGVAAGAFDADGRLLGFVFGISGLRHGRPAHWSDMLGVREGYRDRGLGRRLKAFQREQLLGLGIQFCYWSYDPLEARNAHVNLNHLGARPVEYVPDMYGDIARSTLLAGLATDRFIVEWQLGSPQVEAALGDRLEAQPISLADVPVVNTQTAAEGPRPEEVELLELPAVRVEIPWDIQRVKSDTPEQARDWRGSTRRAFVHYMGRGYRVVGLLRDREAFRCFYILERP
jgi:predicted GNAT superfamily acetyltransferase